MSGREEKIARVEGLMWVAHAVVGGKLIRAPALALYGCDRVVCRWHHRHLLAATGIPRDVEVVFSRGKLVQCQRVDDVSAVDSEVLAAGMVFGAGAGVELQPGQVDDIFPEAEADRVAEYVAGQRPILDLERSRSLEQDEVGAGRADFGKVERAGFEEGAAGIGVAGVAEGQRAWADLGKDSAGTTAGAAIRDEPADRRREPVRAHEQFVGPEIESAGTGDRTGR